MKKYKMISTLRFLNVSPNMAESITLMPGVYIVSNQKIIDKFLDEEFKNVAGFIESNHFENANHIIYCETEQSDIFGDFDSHHALLVWLSWIDSLLKDAWLLKDNSIVCESAYCKVTTGSQFEWTSNTLNTPVSNSSGERFEDVSFSLNELSDWAGKNYQVQSYLHKKNSTSLNSFVNKEYSRIGRSLRFINSARLDHHPAIKIAHYCSALESLFSTDNSELTHKLSERVALFLKDYDYNVGEIFDEVKSYYSIRSKVMHGDSIQRKKADCLAELSVNCDSLLRKIINIIINSPSISEIFDGSKEKLEKYFRAKLFS